MMRKALWYSMLDADMNARYWSYLSRRFYNKDQYSKVFLAIMSSGTVASWGFWSDISIVWKALSACSMLLAIALPVLNWQKMISNMGVLKQYWYEIKTDYEITWLALEQGKSESDIGEEYKKIKQKETEANQNETNMPHDKKLLWKCREEVLFSRGLK
ncbi:MAG TPA: hypothetical protein VIN67_03875 [Desulfobaccales bacterium]